MKALQEQVILVTGSTDGLGRMVAQDLAQQGASVLLHGRDPAKGASVLAEILAATGNPKLRYYNADLASLAEVRDLALRLRINEPRLDVLVNNAGIGPIAPGLPRRLSADGHELLFAVNYLAGFLLARELLPLLLASTPARIINVASIGQQPRDFGNLLLERDYDDAPQRAMDREVDMALSEFDRKELADIDRALGRLGDEDFGICADCAQPIPFARLLAEPYAMRCVGCESRRERRL